MKKLLVFGNKGFVGGYVTQEFLNNGYEVVGADIPECDITSYENVDKIICLVKPTYIINLAAISSVSDSWKNPSRTAEVNINGTINILEAARSLNERPRILLIGSCEQYKSSENPLNEKSELDADNPYGITKITQENYAILYRKAYGLDVVCARSFNHTGIGQNEKFVIPSWCKQIAEIKKGKRQPVIKVGNIEVYRDISNVKDVARAYRMILEIENPDFVYNVGSGTSIQLEMLLKYIIEMSGTNTRIVIDKNLIRPSDKKYTCCDNTLLKEKTAWKPAYNAFETITEIYRWYENEK